VLMLAHIGQDDAAARLELGVARVLADGKVRTADLGPAGPPATTAEVADAVIAATDSK